VNVIIRPYENQDQNQVVSLILDIQQNEFGVSITIEDQPDLLNINAFYRKGNGNFWCALFEKRIVGTLGLIDIGNGYGTIRKMFVHKNYRGKIGTPPNCYLICSRNGRNPMKSTVFTSVRFTI
jgi:hypothetical protein